MKEEFNPKDFASFEELPEDKKPEFKPVEGGFVREGAIEDEKKAEHMAHRENSIRLKLDEILQVTMSEIKKNNIKKAESASEEAGVEYDAEKIIEEFKSIENLQVVRIGSPNCCDSGDLSKVQNVAYQFIGSGAVNSDTFVMKDCSSGYFFIKNRKLRLATRSNMINSVGMTDVGVKREDADYFNSLIKENSNK